MLERVWKKVEHVRAQPEHVRLRYVLVCLAVSMVFILGIWFLSLKESVMNASRDLPKPSDAKLFPEGTPSLKDLLESNAPLQVENTDLMTGAEYFSEEVRRQGTDRLQDEGVSGGVEAEQ